MILPWDTPVRYVAKRHPAAGITAWMSDEEWQAWLASSKREEINASIREALDEMGVRHFGPKRSCRPEGQS